MISNVVWVSFSMYVVCSGVEVCCRMVRVVRVVVMIRLVYLSCIYG